jgi:hypothetical protein
MPEKVRRGYVPTDAEQFNNESITKLKAAQEELLFLIDRGYPIKSAATFIGNHYLLSERQRLALVRATAARSEVEMRLQKLITGQRCDGCVYIDGLNLIITLEVALSGSTLIRCMDGTIRDLAGLRGTYRLIDKTESAIHFIGDKLEAMGACEVVFFLDAPVSNTGRLKSSILELLRRYPFSVSVELVPNVDKVLESKSNVVSSDSIILNKCRSFYNMAADIINERMPDIRIIDLSEVD